MSKETHICVKTKMETTPYSCVDCEFGERYGCVGENKCRILNEYFTNNVKPPYKERPNECPLFETEEVSDMGEVSDGHHTFNELYHHRAVLFSVICNQNKELAWKSKKHSDGSMFDDMFIVGIKTPDGQATYHYNIDPYWNMFHVNELEYAPEWDGHTPLEAIERIGKIGLGD